MAIIINSDLDQLIYEINNDMPRGFYLKMGVKPGFKVVDLMHEDLDDTLRTLVSEVKKTDVHRWLKGYHKGILVASGRY